MKTILFLFLASSAQALPQINPTTQINPAGNITVSSYTAIYGLNAASATLTGTGSGLYSLVTSSGINVQAGQVNGSGAGLTGTGPNYTAGTANNLGGGSSGNVPYQTGAGATGFVSNGANGQFLSFTGSVPAWASVAGGGLSDSFFTSGTSTTVTSPNTAIYDETASTFTVTISTFGAGFVGGSLLEFINASTNSMVIVSSPEYIFDNTGFSTQTTSANNMLVVPPNNSIQLKFTVANSTAQWAWSNNTSFQNFCNQKPITYGTVGNSTYTAINGCGAVDVKVWAGGGGGDECSNTNYPGGGGGGFAEAICGISAGQTYQITVGSGGAGGVASVSHGSAGTPSTYYWQGVFGSSVSATAGSGGSIATPGAAGQGSVNGCILVNQSSGGIGGAAGTPPGGGGGGAGGGGVGASFGGGSGGSGTGGGNGGAGTINGNGSPGAQPGGGGGSCSSASSFSGGAGGAGMVIVTPLPTVGSFYNNYSNIIGGGWTVAGALSYTGNNVMTQSTMTVQGNAFSVGGSSFSVGGGSVTVAYGLTTQNLTASTATFNGPVTLSSAAFAGVTLSTQTAGAAGAAVTALCYQGAGYFALSGQCSCTSAVGLTSVTAVPNCVTAGCHPTGYTCQDAGGTGAQCAVYIECSRMQ